MGWSSNEKQREYRAKNPGKSTKYNKRWIAKNPKHWAWCCQKQAAKRRGIEFNFTLDEWIEWWGDDWDRRGRCKKELVMARYNDEGAYEINNIYKTTTAENVSEYQQRVKAN